MFCKKLVILGLGVAGTLAVTNAVWSGSVSTAFNRVRTAVERQVSPEFELERIRHQIAKLTPDMNKHIETIAEATVEVAALSRRIDVVKGELDKRQSELLALTDRVESGVTTVGFGGPNVKDKLARDLKSYKNCEKDLASKQKLLEAKRESLEAARRQLGQIQEQRQELEVIAAQYEAEIANLHEAQARSRVKVDLDDSRLAKIKDSLEKLHQRIELERTKVELAGQFTTNGTLESLPTTTADSGKDVVEEVRSYFNKREAAKK